MDPVNIFPQKKSPEKDTPKKHPNFWNKFHNLATVIYAIEYARQGSQRNTVKKEREQQAHINNNS